MDTRTGMKGLAFLRMTVGAWLVWSVLPNLDHSFIEGLPPTLEHFSQTNPYDVYRWLMNTLAIPHVEQVGTLLSVGQLLVGSALLIGFFTRFIALIGALYAVNLLLVTGHLSNFHQSLGILLLLTFVTFMVGDAGCAYGVDGFLFKPKSEEKSAKPKFKNKKQKNAVEALGRQMKNPLDKKKKAPAKSK